MRRAPRTAAPADAIANTIPHTMRPVDALAAELMIQVAAWDTRGWPRPDVVLVTGSALDVDLGETLIDAAAAREPAPLPHPRHRRASPRRRAGARPRRSRRPLLPRAHPLLSRLRAERGGLPRPARRAARRAGRDPHQRRRLARPRDAAGHHRRARRSPEPRRRQPAARRAARRVGRALPSAQRRLRSAAARAGARRSRPSRGSSCARACTPGCSARATRPRPRSACSGRVGATLVGMSTVPEVIALRHLGVACAAFSLVTNLAAGLAPTLPSHEEVMAEGERAAGYFGAHAARVDRSSRSAAAAAERASG